MKKILFLNYEYPPLGGGAANATLYILKEFSKYKDLEVDLVTSSTNNFRVEKISKNVTIHFLDIKKKGNLQYQSNKNLLAYSFKSYFYCKKLMKKNDYDLCHAFFGIPCGYIAMKLKIPYIVSLRGSDVPFYNERYKHLDRLCFRRLSRKIWENANQVVANSEGLKDLATQTYVGKDIKVIPNGIDIREFEKKKKNEQKGKREKKGKKERIKLVSTGRLIPRKGYEFLIKALKGSEDFELTLVGNGPLRESLENLAKENCVRVNFLGEVKHEEIPKILQGSDVFVLPSFNEGMSNSILEAMACGLPIVTTDTGGSKELVNKNGFVVKKGSVDDLKRVLGEFKNNRELISQMGDISRDVAEKMSWENVVKKYYEIYYD